MNKYLGKIASEPEKKKSNFHVGAALGTTIAGSVLATPINLAQQSVAKKVISKVNAPSDSGADLGTIRKYMKDTGLKNTTTFNVRHHNIDKMTFKGKMGKMTEQFLRHAPNAAGPSYMHTRSYGAKKDFIVGKGYGNGKINPDVIMHELGHAKDFASHGKLKLAIRGGARVGGGIGTLAALSNDKTRDYAPAIAAIPGLATLRDEGMANYHAYHGIKAHKSAAAANKFVRKLLPAQMGSYALGAAAPVAGAYIAKKLMDRIHPKDTKK